MNDKTDSAESSDQLLARVTSRDHDEGFRGRDRFSLIPGVILVLAVFVCLYVSSLYSYLLFHSIAEIFSISVCVSIFIITLNSRGFIQNGYLLFIGVAYFFVAVLDGLHTLAYRGMGVFPGYDANLPTQLWIAARYLQSISLLIAPAYFRNKPNLSLIFLFYTAICAALFIAIFSRNIFPDCFIEGVGLTSFKIISEYIISIILLVSLLLLALNRRQFESGVFKLLAASIIITTLSELAFTSYVSVYGFANLLGHFLKILAFYLVYKALVETGLKRPYSLIFRELCEEREKLKAEIQTKERLQKALGLSEEKYRTVADFAYDWEYWTNPEGDFVYVSPSCERITGYTSAEFIANPNLIMDIMLDDDRQLFELPVSVHLSNANSIRERATDFRIRHKNGEIRWIGHVSQAVYGNSQQYLGIRTTNRDITDRKQAEEALRESEERLRSILDSLHDFVFVVDEEGIFRDYHQPMDLQKLFVPPQEFIGRHYSEVLPQDVSRLLEEGIRSVKTRGSVEQFDYSLVIDGEKDWFNAKLSARRTVSGIFDGVTIVSRDITDRKKAEEERDRLFNLSSDMLCVAGYDGFFKQVNPAWSKILGWTSKELIDKPWIESVHPDDRAGTLLAAKRLEHELQLVSWENRYRHKDGGYRWLSWNTTTLPDERLSFSVVRDITDLKLLEKERAKAEEKSTSILESISDAFFSLDDNMVVTYFNQAAAKALGRRREEVIGHRLFDVFHEAKGSVSEEIYTRSLKEKIPLSFETYFEIPPYANWYDVRVYPGQEGISVFFQVVTERKRLEDERLELQHKLLHSQKLESLAVMAGGIAHDFNNQLAVVLGNLELALLDLSPESKVRPSIEDAVQAAKRSSELSKQMQIYTGNVLYYPVDLDLHDLLNRNSDLIEMCVSKHVALHFETYSELPAIKGDPDQIQRLVMNILGNASESIGDHDGKVTFITGVMDCDKAYLGRSRLEDKPEPGRFVFLEVIDTGCGMDAVTQHKIFDPFFSTKFWGRGLGMAEVMGTVKGHRGAIMLDSNVGKGTTIRVLFPVPEEVHALTVQDKALVELKAPVSESVSGRKTILLVEDEELVRDLAIKRLDLLGYDTISAADGEEGVGIFRERLNEIDLVMLDFKMPKMDGVEAFAELIRIKPDVKVILSSGYTEDVVIERFPGPKPAGILHKPYDMDDLKAELDRLLGTTG